MNPEFDVAVVGSGPTGLTLANLLGLNGAQTVLIERCVGTVQQPRAVSIDDESLRTMQAIGLIDKVLKDVAQDYGSLYFTARGRQFAAVVPSTREYGFPRRSAFRQPDLEATLREGLKRFSCVTCLFESALEKFETRGDKVDVHLRTAKGESIAFGVRYLAGCDGARSGIRKQIGSILGGSSYDERWLIIDLASTKESLRQTRVICDPARPLLTLPGPGGVRRYEFMLHDGETDEIATSPNFVRKLLEANGPDADEPIVRRQVYAFHARLADKWRSGPVFLAGDAAHLSPPFAGQGMNSGVRDAHNLGWKLGAVIKGQFGRRLLETYQAERLPHAKAMVQLSINIGHVMMPRSRAQAWLTQTAFQVMKLTPRIQSYFVEMKYKPKPFYETGFIIEDDSGLHLAGRMLPQPMMDLGSSKSILLDELLGQGFALVAYGPYAQATLGAAAECDFGLSDLNKIAVIPGEYNADLKTAARYPVVRDMAQGFRRFQPLIKDCLILVRPDRYVVAAALAKQEAIVSLAARVRALVANTCEREPALVHDQPAASAVTAA